MKKLKNLAVLALALLSAPSLLLAQNYPPPATVAVPQKFNNLPLAPYSAPIKSWAGRIVDSQATRDFQNGTPVRTLRARAVLVDSDRGRVYMALGAHLTVHKTTGFFSRLASKNMASIGGRSDGVAIPGEKYLPWDDAVYPETDTNWRTITVDGQDRLYGIDIDDRGYVYAAYSTFGWGILRENDGSFSLAKQVLDQPGGITAVGIISFNAGSKYYALVTDGTAQSNLFDVTNPTDPIHLGARAYGPAAVNSILTSSWAKARLGSSSAVAFVDSSGAVNIYAAETIVNGGRVDKKITAPSGTTFGAVTSDGTNFWAAAGSYYVSTSSLVKMSSNGVSASSFNDTVNTTTGALAAQGVRYGAGYLTVHGLNAQGASVLRLYKLTGGVPVEIDLNDYFRKAYTSPDSGFAKPSGYCSPIRDAVMINYSGKDYLIYAGNGLGDVFEIAGRDGIDIDTDPTAGYGTANPNSPTRTAGPFFGDPITFKSTAGPSISRIHWSFDNSESGAENQLDASVGVTFTRQFFGATTAAAAGRTRTVVANAYGDPDNTDSVSVAMTAPAARIGIAGTTTYVTAPQALGTVVVGDSFTDSSDGSVQGHYGVWTLDGQSTSADPTYKPGVGVCGAHTLTYEAHYVPYSGTGTSVTPRYTADLHYVVGVGSVSYEVKPFVADIAIASSDATSIVFRNAARIGSAGSFAGGSSTPWSVKWELLDASGAVVNTTTTASTISASDRFTVAKSSVTPGSKVRLTITMDAAQIAQSSCAPYLTSVANYELKTPDPAIAVTGCANVGDPCTVTANSVGGLDQSSWTYAWTVDGAAITGSKTASPSFTTAKSYVVAVTATNSIGSGNASQSLTVNPSQCPNKPNNITFSVQGASGCLGSNCTDYREELTFKPSAFGYTFQSCDSFLWEFGDSSTSTERSPKHKFPRSGPFTVRLVVTNSKGSAEISQSVLGTVVQPPPPPQCAAISSGSIYPSVNSGATCSGTSCSAATGTSIVFNAAAWGYTVTGCESYSWDFGDGTGSSTRTPSKTFSAAGTYTVTLTYSNTVTGPQSSSLTLNVTGGGGNNGCNAIPNSANIYYSYKGAESSCTNPNTPCRQGETITFTAASFGGYQFQSCDTITWSFGDGTTGSGKTVTHTFNTPNDYDVKLTVTNASSTEKTSQLKIPVQASQPAEPTPTNPQITASTVSVPLGGAITFTGSAEPAAMLDKFTYRWTFGDGTFATGRTIQKTFNVLGNYTVTLTVLNNVNNQAQATKQIAVTNGKSFAFLLPVVAHLNGVEGSVWRSDVQIFNPDPSFAPTKPLELTFEFNGATKKLLLDSSTYVAEDFMVSFLKAGCSGDACNDAGPVIVRGIGEVAPQMWTRTYNQSASGLGTFGQLIPAVPIETTAPATTTAAKHLLPGMRRSARYRTNLGLVNPNSSAIDLTITAYDDRNVRLGQNTVNLRPYSLTQLSDNQLASMLAIPGEGSYNLTVESLAGASLMAYASIIDNTSGDPVFLSAIPDSQQTDGALQKQMLPGVGHLTNGNWKSDITLYNPDSSGAVVDLSYYDQAGAKVSEVKNVVISSSTFLQVPDFLTAGVLSPQLGSDASSYGTLVVETKSASTKFPIVYARTYSDQLASGTFGQGIPGFAASKGNVKAGTKSFIAGVRNDQKFTTNFGLVNSSSVPSRVRVTLLDRATGAALGQIEYPSDPTKTLAPFEALIQPNIFGALNTAADRATLMVEVVSGGPVWAYASIIDKTTKDPEYVPAESLK